MFSTVWGWGWINGNSVGLDTEKHILGCSSAWLMRIRLTIEFSTRKLGVVGTRIALPGSRGVKTHFPHR